MKPLLKLPATVLFTLLLTGVAYFAGCKAGPDLKTTTGDYVYLVENPEYGPRAIHPAPADGDTVFTDPPGFNWQPEEGSRGFILEISRDPGFAQSEELLEEAAGRGSLVPGALDSSPVVAGGGSSWLVSGLPCPFTGLHSPWERETGTGAGAAFFRHRRFPRPARPAGSKFRPTAWNTRFSR